MRAILLLLAAGFAVLGAASDGKDFQMYESDAGFLSEQVNSLAVTKEGRSNCTKFTTTVGQAGKKCSSEPSNFSQQENQCGPHRVHFSCFHSSSLGWRG
jgi:hypothetical protein